MCPPLPPHLMLCSPRDKGQCRPPAPSWSTPRSPQSAGRTKAAIRGIHYMCLHLSELKKNRERPCSPLGSGLLGEIRQLRPSPSTYRGETEVSGGGIHSLLFCFPLKQLTRALVTSTHLFSRIQLHSGPKWMKWKVNCQVTRQKGPGQWPSPPFSSVPYSSGYSSNVPNLFPPLGLGLAVPTPRTHLP